MAFKMKGSAFKLNNVATKSALKQTKEEHKEIKDRLKGEDLTEAERKAILDKLKAGYEKEKESEEKAPTQMKSPMKQEEAPISSVTGKPYPPYVMKKSPEGEYSARKQAMESFDKMKFAEKSSSDELTDRLLDETTIKE